MPCSRRRRRSPTRGCSRAARCAATRASSRCGTTCATRYVRPPPRPSPHPWAFSVATRVALRVSRFLFPRSLPSVAACSRRRLRASCARQRPTARSSEEEKRGPRQCRCCSVFVYGDLCRLVGRSLRHAASSTRHGGGREERGREMPRWRLLLKDLLHNGLPGEKLLRNVVWGWGRRTGSRAHAQVHRAATHAQHKGRHEGGNTWGHGERGKNTVVGGKAWLPVGTAGLCCASTTHFI